MTGVLVAQHYPGPWTPDIVPTLVSTAHFPGAGHSLLAHAVDISGATQTTFNNDHCRLLLLTRPDHFAKTGSGQTDGRLTNNCVVSTGATVGSLCTIEQRGAAAAAGCSPFAGGWSAVGSAGTMAGASSSNSSLLLPLPKITAGSDRPTAVPTRAIELVRRSKREKKRLAF